MSLLILRSPQTKQTDYIIYTGISKTIESIGHALARNNKNKLHGKSMHAIGKEVN